MVVKPRIRGFVCVTAHPDGCAAHVQQQIAHVRKKGRIGDGPKRVLVLGASTGYGLSSRIAAAFGSGAATIGVFFERPSDKGRPATAGWYNSMAVEEAAQQEGLYAKSINGDAFSNEIREQTIDLIKADLEQVDLVVYSLAAPRRTDPTTGQTYKSVLKPIGRSFTSKTVDTDKKVVHEVSLEPATQTEISETKKVMGGEDWQLWINALSDANCLAPQAKTVAYSYIGPDLTYPIYHEGTIGNAKSHLEDSAQEMRRKGISAYVSVNKAVVTQASSAIPVVPLYISILFKVMKEKGLHEGCIEQIDRLFRTRLYTDGPVQTDRKDRVRVDDWEMRDDVQNAVCDIWPSIETENLEEMSDFAGYQTEFLKLFGFGLPGVAYSAETEVERDIPSLA